MTATTIIRQRLEKVNLGPAQHYQNLTMFPLLDPEPRDAGFLLLNEALGSGRARVTEVSEGGSVPELKFVNDADLPVLLLDGEELVGAKQNRIVNLTILVPAATTIVIPVSCVEQGRWRSQSDAFAAAGRTHYAAGRARKACRVSESLARAGSRRGDQSEIWEDIEAKSSRMKASSPTTAAAAIYEAHRHRLEDYQQAFTAVDNQTGALFAINGRAVGLDLFDSLKPLRGLFPGIVQSYALDAIDNFDREAAKPAPIKVAQALLQACAAAEVSSFPAVGKGCDLRLRGAGITGGALAVEERVIHLCAFRPPAATSDHPRSGARLVRASRRRRQWSDDDVIE